MTSAKKRNHYIPRVLLNRFASYREPAKGLFKIWRYSKDHPLKEISTKDVAVGSYFYGREDSELEDKLGAIESKLASALTKIDDKQPPSDFNDFLSDYAWVQAIRTRSFRDRVSRTMSGLLSGFADRTESHEVRAALRARGEKLIQEEVDKFSPFEREYIRRALGGISFETLASLRLAELINSGEFGRQLSQLLRGFVENPLLTKGLATGHNQALSKMIDAEKLSPDIFRASWQLVKVSGTKLVLGDSCIIAINLDGLVQPLTDAINWRALYFPIDASTHLVGHREAAWPVLGADEINRASAASSTGQFFASEQTGELAELVALIGSATNILSQDETQDIVKSVWQT
jgi:hypothetical protein